MSAVIHLAPSHLMRQYYTAGGQAALLAGYRAGEFEKKLLSLVPDKNLTAMGVAELCFDITNNPSRQEERELVYGRHRSLSVGDIVEVEDRGDPEKVTLFLCESYGWKELSF